MAAHTPVGTGVSVAIGAASTYATFNQQSEFVRICAVGGACHVAIGTEPTAATSDYYVPSGGTAVLSLSKVRSNRISGFTTAQTLNSVASSVLDIAEGHGCQFIVGDLVSLDATIDGFDFGTADNAAYVTAINQVASPDGYNGRRVTVDFDSTALTYTSAFDTAAWTDMRRMIRVGVIGSHGSSGHVQLQQVQVAGDA